MIFVAICLHVSLRLMLLEMSEDGVSAEWKVVIVTRVRTIVGKSDSRYYW